VSSEGGAVAEGEGVGVWAGGYCFLASQRSSWMTGLNSEEALVSATVLQQESQEARSPTEGERRREDSRGEGGREG
jgi:hypothetical protein